MIINLTQHVATPAQKQAGVIDLPEDERETLKHLLTFTELPSVEGIRERAHAIVSVYLTTHSGDEEKPAEAAMIGGAPYLMAPLEQELRRVGITPVYAFSRRESVEETTPDGTVTKRNVFRHLGFIEV